MLKLDAHRKRLFCEMYAKTGLLIRAAEAVDVTDRAVYDQRKMDPEFDEAVKLAYRKFQEHLEDEARARAVDGWDEPVYYRGEECGSIRRKSDRILELVLKRHIGEYRDHQRVDMNVTGGVLVVPPVSKSAEEWEEGQNGGKQPE